MSKIAAPAITVHLTPDLKELVEGKVRSGEFASTSEVVRSALRAWAQQDHIEDPRLESLIEDGLRSPVRRLTPQVIAQIRRRVRRSR